MKKEEPKKKQNINEFYDEHSLHKWWCDELPKNSIINELIKDD